MSDNSDVLNQLSADQRKVAEDAKAPVADEKIEQPKGRTVKAPATAQEDTGKK